MKILKIGPLLLVVIGFILTLATFLLNLATNAPLTEKLMSLARAAVLACVVIFFYWKSKSLPKS